MIDSYAAQMALRSRMLSLVVATTGAVSLSANADGFSRATGSFLADGLVDGEEFLSAGFGVAGNNGYRVIESVSALRIYTTTTTTAEAAGAGRTISVGLPQGRAFSNRTFNPVPGRPYIEEDFVPGGHSLIGYPSQGSRNEESGLYVIRFYGLQGKGEGAIRRPVDALKRLFAPGTVLPLSDGTVIRMSRDSAVVAGQILPQGDGWAVCSVSIPWLADSTNLITA